jgi:hypothetical protein
MRFTDEEEEQLEVVVHYAVEKVKIVLSMDYDEAIIVLKERLGELSRQRWLASQESKK